MTSKQLNNYIKQCLKLGKTKEEIVQNLLKAGWKNEQIDESFLFIQSKSEAKQDEIVITKSEEIKPEIIDNPQENTPVTKEEILPIIKEEKIIPNQEEIKKPNISKKMLIIFIILIGFVLLCGSFVYAYVQKIGPFAPPTYTEANLFSGLLTKTSQIKSSSYTASVNLNVSSRDKDAVPFSIESLDNEESRKKYYNDTIRIENVSLIIAELNLLSGYNSYSKTKTIKAYPSSIQKLFSTTKDIIDPATGKNYEYQIADNGKNFVLTIDFETDSAISAIKNYNYEETSTVIAGKKVSFTKDSSTFLYMSSEPPKPFLVEMIDSMSSIPSDTSAKASFSISSESKAETMPDWVINVSAEGDLGDLAYKVNADAIKKDKDYYIRINNFPNLLFLDFSSLKGKWISISPESLSSSEADDLGLSFFKTALPEAEKMFKENNEKSIRIIKKMVALADKEKLITFKSKPKLEKINNRELVKYELNLRKEAVVSFYTKLQEEIKNDPDFSEYANLIDQNVLDYLGGEEFNQTFTYINENNTFILWTDTDGFPAIIQNSVRIVPLDTATNLKDKQINIVFEVMIKDINIPVKIDAPTESEPIQEAIKGLGGSLVSSSILAKDARIKAAMDQMRSTAEIYKLKNVSYNNTGKNITLTNCSLMMKSFTEEKDFSSLCVDIQSLSSGASNTNISNGKSGAYCIAKELNDHSFWCIDSTGFVGSILNMNACNSKTFNCRK
ncbi:MAG: hypothetical protein WC319_01110 [Candidatus Paceibacterota bacterium]|jgi:hypothetical protein